jgi:hypothetical protein
MYTKVTGERTNGAIGQLERINNIGAIREGSTFISIFIASKYVLNWQI